MKYTEHDKLKSVQSESQAAGELLEWLGNKGIFLAHYVDGHNFPQEYRHGRSDLADENDALHTLYEKETGMTKKTYFILRTRERYNLPTWQPQ